MQTQPLKGRGNHGPSACCELWAAGTGKSAVWDPWVPTCSRQGCPQAEAFFKASLFSLQEAASQESPSDLCHSQIGLTQGRDGKDSSHLPVLPGRSPSPERRVLGLALMVCVHMDGWLRLLYFTLRFGLPKSGASGLCHTQDSAGSEIWIFVAVDISMMRMRTLVGGTVQWGGWS